MQDLRTATGILRQNRWSYTNAGCCGIFTGLFIGLFTGLFIGLFIKLFIELVIELSADQPLPWRAH